MNIEETKKLLNQVSDEASNYLCRFAESGVTVCLRRGKDRSEDVVSLSSWGQPEDVEKIIIALLAFSNYDRKRAIDLITSVDAMKANNMSSVKH